MVKSLRDKGVLVTGAGRGLGKRLAVGFAAAGARVGLLARSKAELDLAHLEIEHAGGAAHCLYADVTDFEQIAAAVQDMRVDALIAAAAVQGPIGPLAQTPPAEWAQAITTNLVGVMNCCRAVLPQMIERRSGKIVVLSGEGACGPRPNFSAFAAAKAGLVRLVETLAEEVRDHNIQVNAITPGAAYTHMTDQILEAGDRAGWKEREEALQLRITGGVAPDKQIQLALFLASDRSNHISGKLIHITDDWPRLEKTSLPPDLYTLRRVQRA